MNVAGKPFLSPDPFLIIMTIPFNDIHPRDTHLSFHRVFAIDYDEVVYANDTISASENTGAMNTFLKHTNEDGTKYGLRLNTKMPTPPTQTEHEHVGSV